MATTSPPGEPGELALSDDWRVWVVDNLLRGLTPATLMDTLVRDGEIPEDVARAEVEAIATSPALVACKRMSERLRRFELLRRLRCELWHMAPEPRAIERRSGVSPDELLTRYFASNTPVVLTDITRDWPALERWSPDYFAERYGDAVVEVVRGREGDRYYDQRFAEHCTKMTMREYVALVRQAGESNDIYMIARNCTLQRSDLAPLLDDVATDVALVDRDKLPRNCSLWFGPAGTLTPLHHDATNNLFCQIYGRKRVQLISPLEPGILDRLRGFYLVLDAQDADLDGHPELPEGTLVHTVELSPGDALFIPAGWLHQVRSLELSITVSMLAFHRPNAYRWYTPGFVGLES